MAIKANGSVHLETYPTATPTLKSATTVVFNFNETKQYVVDFLTALKADQDFAALIPVGHKIHTAHIGMEVERE